MLAAGEAMNAYDLQKAILILDIAGEQLYPHQLTMFDVLNSLFSNTRTHFQQSINDTQAAIWELTKVITSLAEKEKGHSAMINYA